MRFYIKAYAMHEDELAALSEEAQNGALEADDIGEGMVEAIADEDAIRRLAAKGVVVQAVAQVPEDTADGGGVEMANDIVPDAGDFDPEAGDFDPGPPDIGAFGRSVDRHRVATAAPPQARSAGPEYWLVDIIAGMSDRLIQELQQAGAEITERDPSGSFVVRTTAGEEQLEALPFVGEVKRYGTQETIEGAASLLPDAEPPRPPGERGLSGVRARRTRDEVSPSKGRFEAICHRKDDLTEVQQGMERLGARIVGGSGRTLRFIANRADLELIAGLPGVASIAKKHGSRLLTDHALPLIGFTTQPANPAHFPFDGAGEIVGVADTGLDTNHPDFNGRVVAAIALGRPGDSSDPDGHGTHVAGTIAGDGTASRPQGSNDGLGPLRGVAPASRIYFQSVLDINNGLGGLPEDLAQLFDPAYQFGVRVHNNSWGAYLQSRYDTMALDVDQYVYDHPDFLPVIAAGNEGSCRPGLQSPQGFVDYPSLGAPATSKNGLTVGASRSNRVGGGFSMMRWGDAWPDDFDQLPIANETISGGDQGLAAFSSRGPCDDMRIKPDLVAPGTDIAAAKSSDAPLSHFWGAVPRNRQYGFMGGTSMACPIVAGCALLVRQYYREERQYATPSAALVKATLINGTVRLDGTDSVAGPDGAPNYHQGFGRIDMARTIPDPQQPGFDLYFADSWRHDTHLTFNGRRGRRRWAIALNAAGELRITLAWTDPPGRALQNQLRLILDSRNQGQTANWVGNQDASAPIKVPSHDPRALLPGAANVLTRDPHNNVQVIRIDAVAGSYTLALFADSLLFLPQDFALVITTPAGTAQITEI